MPIDIASVVAAVGALGTASFALVDASKILKSGGASNSGFSFIENAVRNFFPGAKRNSSSDTAGKRLLDVLHSNWINGAALGDQKAIAKSMIKLGLTPETAKGYADATGVDAQVLAAVAKSMTAGKTLKDGEINVLGRFDLALTAILDDGYQRADQKYRNGSRVYAALVSIVLAVAGGWTIAAPGETYFNSPFMWQAVLCGLLATPLAPISKDLASALSAGVKVAQSLRK